MISQFCVRPRESSVQQVRGDTRGCDLLGFEVQEDFSRLGGD